MSMSAHDRITDLLTVFNQDALARALESAYARGFEDAQAQIRASVLRAVEAPAGLTPEHLADSLPAESPDEESAKRAPRGLTRSVITAILRHRGASSMQEIQAAAVMADERVLAKTVYNELKREIGVIYTNRNELWSLLGDSPMIVANSSDHQQEDFPV